MSHLHIPDGVLPVVVWGPGLLVALLLLVASARSLRGITRQRVALVVHALKYGGRPGLADALAGRLARALPGTLAPDLVSAVPLHPARRRERGYNQAGLLADALSDVLGAPRLEGVLERVRPTRPQARLAPRARRENVADAFLVRRPRWLEGRHVLIVDDVMTTGATLEACLDAAARAGAAACGVVLAWAQ